LLVGSIGLFAILAAVMYFSRKIDWSNANSWFFSKLKKSS
jgi:inner membrane protein